MSDISADARVLSMGERLAAHPCVVVVDFLNRSNAVGWCESCNDRHIIDRPRYEAGRGPWRPVK